MGEMLIRKTLHQPTLMQMDFVQPLAKKWPPLPFGWQHNTCETTGKAFYYSHVASGRIISKFEDMVKTNWEVMPSQAPSVPVELFPDNPVSGAYIYVTSHHFMMAALQNLSCLMMMMCLRLFQT
jgi:hypothetical protein